MDRKKLATKIEKFRKACEAKGYPLKGIYVDEAYPGVNSTSVILKVVAEWANAMGSSKALDILIDTLWETFDEQARKHIFAIYVFGSIAELQSRSNEIENKRLAQTA